MELPQTVALPASCNYELPPSLPDSARCYYVSVSPSNNQSTSAIAFPPSGGTAFHHLQMFPLILIYRVLAVLVLL